MTPACIEAVSDLLLPGPGLALGSSFRESFDSLSGSSQQALQQLATKSAKLLPEGTSIRDSYDKLSYSSQHALHHLVKSGIPLPSLLPDKQAGLEVSATDGSPMSDWTAQLSSANTETQHAQADARAAQHELQKAQQENQMLSDLLQRSQADLKLSQDHTHELLASVTQHTDANKALEQRYSAVRKELAEAVRIAKSCQQSDNGILPKCTNDSMGPLVRPTQWHLTVSPSSLYCQPMQVDSVTIG